MKAMLVMVALCAPLAAQAVYKCKGDDGRIVYSDAPCPAQQTSVKISGMAHKAQPQRPASPSELIEAEPPGAGRPTARPARIDFGASPEARLVSVVALLDSLALDGSDCESALRGDSRKVTPCATFVTHMAPGREWPQALAEMHALLKEPGLFERRRTEFAKASGLIDRIAGHRRYMEARIGTRQ